MAKAKEEITLKEVLELHKQVMELQRQTLEVLKHALEVLGASKPDTFTVTPIAPAPIPAPAPWIPAIPAPNTVPWTPYQSPTIICGGSVSGATGGYIGNMQNSPGYGNSGQWSNSTCSHFSVR